MRLAHPPAAKAGAVGSCTPARGTAPRATGQRDAARSRDSRRKARSSIRRVVGPRQRRLCPPVRRRLRALSRGAGSCFADLTGRRRASRRTRQETCRSRSHPVGPPSAAGVGLGDRDASEAPWRRHRVARVERLHRGRGRCARRGGAGIDFRADNHGYGRRGKRHGRFRLHRLVIVVKGRRGANPSRRAPRATRPLHVRHAPRRCLESDRDRPTSGRGRRDD